MPLTDTTIRRVSLSQSKAMSGHGFRAMARTILDEVLGVRPDFIEHQHNLKTGGEVIPLRRGA